MTHPLFHLPNASEYTLDLMMIGVAGSLAFGLWVVFMIWRDRRRGLGKPKPPPSRNRKVRKRPASRTLS